MEKKRTEISEESINNLIANTGNHIRLHGQTIETIVSLYNLCNSRLKDSQMADNEHLLKFKALLEVILTYSFAEIELSALFRADLIVRDDTLYRRTVLLQSFRVISESTKALFGFGKDKKNAFWNKLVTLFDLSQYATEVDEIRVGVKSLSAGVINKGNRDIASHYSWDAVSVADTYCSIKDEDLICQNLNKYGYVIERVSKISDMLLCSFLNSIEHLQNNLTDTAAVCPNFAKSIPTELVWKFEKTLFKPNLVNVIKSSYKYNTRQLEECVGKCRGYQRLAALDEMTGITIKDSEVFLCYSKIMNSVGLLLFMMNDALAAAVACADSVSFWESRINLKRLYVSAYEALDKVVGFSDDSKDKCLFHLVNQIINDLPVSLKEQYKSLKKDTDTIVIKYGFNQMNRRNSFVHYRSKKTIWLVRTYGELMTISIPDALCKVIELKKLSTKILYFINSFSSSFAILQEIKFKENVNQMFQPLRLVVEKCPNKESKEIVLKMLEDFQKNIVNLSPVTNKTGNNGENII